MYADAITTVSPTHAREIATDEYGMGLQSDLRARASALSGILNGVDYEEWDPRHDRYLAHHYDPQNMAGKAALKRDIIARFGLKAGPDTPIFGIVSRLAQQKGHDLLFDSLPELLAWRDFAFVVLGSGEAKYETFFQKLQDDYPGRVSFSRGYNDELAHFIEAASDIFVMPSLYEPCGLNQMYSLRYGTVPLVRKTGGLADSVVPYDPSNGEGTGIVFDDFNSEALEWAMNTALDLYAQPAHWQRMVQNGMAQDFSWQHQGASYLQLYEETERTLRSAQLELAVILERDRSQQAFRQGNLAAHAIVDFTARIAAFAQQLDDGARHVRGHVHVELGFAERGHVERRAGHAVRQLLTGDLERAGQPFHGNRPIIRIHDPDAHLHALFPQIRLLQLHVHHGKLRRLELGHEQRTAAEHRARGEGYGQGNRSHQRPPRERLVADGSKANTRVLLPTVHSVQQ